MSEQARKYIETLKSAARHVAERGRLDAGANAPFLEYRTTMAKKVPAAPSQTFRNFGWVPTVRQSEQAAQLRQETLKRWADARAAAHDRLRPSNVVTDVIGKVGALPLTAMGSALGAANVGLARLAGHKNARMTVGHNALQFEDGLIGLGGRAFTLGNSVIYAPGEHPSSPSRKRYDERRTPASLAQHEMGHSYQYQKFGFAPLYLANLVTGSISRKRNPYEDEADDFGDAISKKSVR